MSCSRNSGPERFARRAAAALIAVVVLGAPSVGGAGEPDLGATSVAPSASAGSARAPATEMTLARLLESMSSVQGLSAKFREEKHMDLLAVPIVNEGELHFAPPGHLLRRTTAPSPSTVLITGDTLSFTDAAGRESIDLASNPAVRMFVDSFVKIYAGDRAALERMYGMAFQVDTAGWTLTLTPRLAPMDKIIASIVLTGEGATLRSMRILERGGDETVTQFSEVRAREFSEAERRELFALPGAASEHG
ncbi:MAG: outer membrane lipoprotein carrier protein LolA [Myxococcales bacterium]|nr:outer membrane lipoprotein carrier protein LolA [Myxococcales bacterium]MCB9748847.1 outer membrane lipoprotein carrier protein LolA [Myxococcales bacterium]